MRAFEHAKDPERRRLRALWLNLSFLYTRTMGPRAKRRRFQRRGLVAGPRKLGARPRAGGRDGLLAQLGFGKATLSAARTTRRR